MSHEERSYQTREYKTYFREKKTNIKYNKLSSPLPTGNYDQVDHSLAAIL